MSTSAILTQTYIDYVYLDKLVTYSYFGYNFGNWSQIQNLDESLLEVSWQKFHNSGQVHLFSFEKKDDYQIKVQTLYKNFETPQLAIFGYIGNLDISVQQAMLKLLEEPPKNIQIVIYGHSLNQILPTIKSRVKVLDLPIQLILSHLNQDLLAQVKKKLPNPTDFCKDVLAKKATIPDLKDLEREEINFWLWQNLYYMQQLYLGQPLEQIANAILSLTQAYNYNNSNLQKKLALGALAL